MTDLLRYANVIMLICVIGCEERENEQRPAETVQIAGNEERDLRARWLKQICPFQLPVHAEDAAQHYGSADEAFRAERPNAVLVWYIAGVRAGTQTERRQVVVRAAGFLESLQDWTHPEDTTSQVARARIAASSLSLGEIRELQTRLGLVDGTLGGRPVPLSGDNAEAALAHARATAVRDVARQLLFLAEGEATETEVDRHAFASAAASCAEAYMDFVFTQAEDQPDYEDRVRQEQDRLAAVGH